MEEDKKMDILTKLNNKVIGELRCDEDCFYMYFNGGECIEIRDTGQNCCEKRFITCDDDLEMFKGAQLLNIELLKEGSYDDKHDKRDEYDDTHEAVFIRVHTTNGSFTLCTHNIHNGYYGGFELSITLKKYIE